TLVLENFVFVHEHDFCARRVDRFVVNHHFLPDQVVGHWRERAPERARPPGGGQIERASGQRVPHFERRPPGTIAPHRGPGGPGRPVRAASGGGVTAGVHRL